MVYKIEKKAPHNYSQGKNNHFFSVRMPYELFKKAKMKAVEYNKSLAEVIREFLESWTTDDAN